VYTYQCKIIAIETNAEIPENEREALDAQIGPEQIRDMDSQKY